MKFQISFLLPLMLFLSGTVYAQDTHTISGHIKCGETGEELIGSAIYVEELQIGAITNTYGFYSLTLPAGTYSIRYSYIGYENREVRIPLEEDVILDFEMLPSPIQMDEVVVVAEAADKNIKEPEMSVVKISPRETRHIPVILGEQDVIKTLQLLPGVKAGSEGSSGFYVRGGGADQNLVILDEAPVYSSSHLLGFFSVFNSDAIKDLELYKGNAPASYGGRLSSVLDIQMKDGNSKRFSTSGGIGILSSRLTLEAPLVKDQGSFIISGRRTYADMFLALSNDPLKKNTKLYFYDLNAKANYRINAKNRIFLSGYSGRDEFKFDDLFSTDWGNNTGTFRWNHVFGNKLFLNSSLIFSDYDYNIGYRVSDNLIVIESGIKALNLKELSSMLRKGNVFFEGNPYVAEILTTHPLLKNTPKLSVFLSPLSMEEIKFFKEPNRNVKLPDFITEIMRRKQLRRKTHQKIELSMLDLDDIETRASSTYREMKMAWQFDYVIPNHDGEDSDNWELFYYPIGEARQTLLTFVSLLQGEKPPGVEKWNKSLLR